MNQAEQNLAENQKTLDVIREVRETLTTVDAGWLVSVAQETPLTPHPEYDQHRPKVAAWVESQGLDFVLKLIKAEDPHPELWSDFVLGDDADDEYDAVVAAAEVAILAAGTEATNPPMTITELAEQHGVVFPSLDEATWDDHDREIAAHRAALAEALDQADTLLHNASNHIDALMSNAVYDVEYADTADGDAVTEIVRDLTRRTRSLYMHVLQVNAR